MRSTGRLDRKEVRRIELRLQHRVDDTAATRRFDITDHALVRFRERCPLVKTLGDVETRARLVELLKASTHWGWISDIPEWPTVASTLRMIAWGPFKYVVPLVPTRDRHYTVKTVLTEEMARRANLDARNGNRRDIEV